MDDEDPEVTDDSRSKRKRKTKKPNNEPEQKRQKTEPPEWFKVFIAQQKSQEPDTGDEELNSDDEDNRPVRASKRIARKSMAMSTDSDDDSDSDFIEYFEDDASKLRESVIKHTLSYLTKDQRAALSSKIAKGVNEAFDLFKDLVSETMEPLLDTLPTTNMWKLGMGPNEIKKYSAMLKELRTTRNMERITIQRVLEAKLEHEQKRKLLNLFDILKNLEPYSVEYLTLSSQIHAIIEAANSNKLSPEQLETLAKKELELKKIIGLDIPMRIRILTADMDDHRKAAIYEKYLLLQKTRDDSVTAANLEEWIEEALKTPYTQMQPNILDTEKPGECLVKLKEGFQQRLSEMDVVLEPLLTIFNNRMYNPTGGSLVIGLLGSPGVGKSKVCRVIADVWGLPFAQISLGGMLDSSLLDGQHPGWVGSGPGRFTKALQDMGVINGVLLLDEIDKLGETLAGLQVQYSLLHSTDSTQNNMFNDHYLGPKLPIDLSHTLIICALNKTDGLDSALLNRMHIIKVPDYTSSQKTSIMLKHLFPDTLDNAGLSSEDITLPPETCSVIQAHVEQYVGNEGGVRGVKTCIRMIVDKLSLLLHTTAEEQEQLKLSFKVDVSRRPVLITPKVVDELYKYEDLNNSWRHLYI